MVCKWKASTWGATNFGSRNPILYLCRRHDLRESGGWTLVPIAATCKRPPLTEKCPPSRETPGCASNLAHDAATWCRCNYDFWSNVACPFFSTQLDWSMQRQSGTRKTLGFAFGIVIAKRRVKDAKEESSWRAEQVAQLVKFDHITQHEEDGLVSKCALAGGR